MRAARGPMLVRKPLLDARTLTPGASLTENPTTNPPSTDRIPDLLADNVLRSLGAVPRTRLQTQSRLCVRRRTADDDRRHPPWPRPLRRWLGLLVGPHDLTVARDRLRHVLHLSGWRGPPQPEPSLTRRHVTSRVGNPRTASTFRILLRVVRMRDRGA
jgi:hypothetical protein